jgi:hypothetical protein
MHESNWIEEQHQLIRDSGILERLVEYVQADPEVIDSILSPSQARMGHQLLRKVLPDIQSIAVAISDYDQRPHRDLSRDEIRNRLQQLHEQFIQAGTDE